MTNLRMPERQSNVETLNTKFSELVRYNKSIRKALRNTSANVELALVLWIETITDQISSIKKKVDNVLKLRKDYYDNLDYSRIYWKSVI